jgi:hypothetical protein
MMKNLKLLFALFVVLALPWPAYAQKTKTVLTTEIGANLASGTGITASTLRTTLIDMVNSWYDLNGASSFTCPTHQWAEAFPTLSSTTCTQPAFTDISGSVAATQLPNPTATTLGGIESYVAVAHQWINAISTSGVPSSTQPAFTDISGSVAATQMPALTGDCTTSAGAVATTCLKTNGASFGGLATVAPGAGVAAALADATNANGGFPVYNAGSWTPGLSGTSGGAATYTTQVGSYEQIGRHVTARFTIVTASVASITGTGLLTGLPVTVANTANDQGGCFVSFATGYNLSTGFTHVTFQPIINTTTANQVETGGPTANASALFGSGQMAAVMTIQGTCEYHS